MDPTKFIDYTKDVKRNLLFAVFLIIVLYIIGIFFFHVIEGWSYLDAAYFLTATFINKCACYIAKFTDHYRRPT